MIAKTKKYLKKQAQLLKPIVRIGKRGLTEKTISEIKKHIKKRKLIKIKLLKAYLEDKSKAHKKEVAESLAEQTESELIEVRGSTVVLAKKK